MHILYYILKAVPVYGQPLTYFEEEINENQIESGI
jgi:hypothetical protein